MPRPWRPTRRCGRSCGAGPARATGGCGRGWARGAGGLVKGERIGVDASPMEADAAMRAIVRRGTGEGYREMLTRMAKESGIETPAAGAPIRLARARKRKRPPNTPTHD